MESAVRAPLVGLREDDRREGLRPMSKRIAKPFRDGNRGMADAWLPLPFPSLT
jgi:GTP cyclohydrolase I